MARQISGLPGMRAPFNMSTRSWPVSISQLVICITRPTACLVKKFSKKTVEIKIIYFLFL